jgi:hypothetical protein
MYPSSLKAVIVPANPFLYDLTILTIREVKQIASAVAARCKSPAWTLVSPSLPWSTCISSAGRSVFIKLKIEQFFCPLVTSFFLDPATALRKATNKLKLPSSLTESRNNIYAPKNSK